MALVIGTRSLELREPPRITLTQDGRDGSGSSEIQELKRVVTTSAKWRGDALLMMIASLGGGERDRPLS